MLASNNLFTGESSLNFYQSAKESAPQTLDLIVSNLPETTQVNNLRKIAGSKHIISAVVDFDNFKGTCKGTGRLQIRLNHGETADQVKLNFLRLGYQVSEFENDPKKRPTVTGTPLREEKQITDCRLEKQYALSTQNPEIFGTTMHYQSAQFQQQ